ncbi:putative chromatin regulator PHD family [Helianthus debilis subsp. tardiflorus]
MICVVYEGYGSSILTLIFITCIWLPFLQIKHAFLHIHSIIMALFYAHDDDHHRHNRNEFPNIYHLSDLRFGDLQDVNEDDAGCGIRSVDETCSICLVEFHSDDTVSQLSRCRHVFHACCVERWLSRDQFTCPLCRSNLLCVPRKKVGLNQNIDEQVAPYWQW